MQAGAAAEGTRFRNPPQEDAVNTPNPFFPLAAPAVVDAMQAPRFRHAVPVALEGARLRLDSGSHRSAAGPARSASEPGAPEPERAP